MNGSKNNIEAILHFTEQNAPDLWTLSGPIVWCLRQADIRIYRHDLAFDGQSMTFETDHGRIRIESRRRDGIPTLTIGASAAIEGSREIARQICYQLSRRILARHTVDSIVWQPTLQEFAPVNFKWGGLRDISRPTSETMRRAMAGTFQSALM